MKNSPLVSILTPTFNRRKFIPQYLRNIKRQDYKGPIEILIADDGDDKIEDLIPKNSIFRYIKLDEKKSIGFKRNLLCNEAKGEILINMDDDDFYPSQRVSHAIERLNKQEAYIAGSSHCYFYDKANGITQFGPLTSYHAHAGTFALFKEYLSQNKYDENVEFGEELSFTHHFTNPLIQLDSLKTILVMCHENNTFDKKKILRNKTLYTLDNFVKNKTEYKFYMAEM